MRQFAPQVTAAQTAFDLCFGVVLPVVCLLADPMVFRGATFLGGGMYAHWVVPAYLFLGTSILAMALWLATRRFAILFAGLFHVGSLVAVGVGTILLPLSLIALVVGIGLLGLVPFGTAFTFHRNAIRARRAAEAQHPEPRVAGVLLLTAFLAVAVPAGVHTWVKRQVAAALTAATSTESAEQDRGVASLRRYARVLPEAVVLDPLVRRWHAERVPARKARLAEAYRAAGGGDVEYRWYQLND